MGLDAIGLLIAVVVILLWERRRRELDTDKRIGLEKRDSRAIVLFCWFYVAFVAFAYLAMALH